MARQKKLKIPVESAFLTMGDNASAVLKGYVNDLDALQEKIRELGKLKKDVFIKAKANGFNTKPLKEVMRRREMEEATRLAFTHEVSQMEKALGMLPLFEYADSLDNGGRASEDEANELAAG